MTKFTRRDLLSKTAAGAAAMLAVATGVNRAGAKVAHPGTPDEFDCAHLHEKMGYRLGAKIVDPALDEVAKNHAIKTAACPHCGTGIAPSGLAFGKHMWS